MTAAGSLPEQTRLVARVGTLLLGAGASGYRVRRAAERVAGGLGLQVESAQVALTSVVLTVRRGDETHTEIAAAPRLGVQAERITAVERLARAVSAGCDPVSLPETVETVAARVAAVARRRPPHRPATVVAAVAVASAGFAALNSGGIVACLAAAVAAGLAQTARGMLHARHLNVFALTAVTAVVAAAAYVSAVGLLNLVLPEQTNPSAGYISAVLFLVPGFPLVTGALDLVKMEFLAGVLRLAYACVLLVSAALGLVLVSSLAGLVPLPLPPDTVAGVDPAELAVLAGATTLGVAGFAVLFQCSWRVVGLAVVAGTVGNVVRLVLGDLGVAVAAATLFGAVVVGLVGAGLAATSDVPRIVLTIPGAIVMVPGNPAFTTLERLARGEILAALDSGLLTVFVVGAIAVGLGIARMVTDREWLFDG